MNKEGKITTTFEEWIEDSRETINYLKETIKERKIVLARDVQRTKKEIVRMKERVKLDNEHDLECIKKRRAYSFETFKEAKESARIELLAFRKRMEKEASP